VSESARPLLAAEATAAIVLGASDWRAAGLGEAPSFRRSAKGVVAWLYDQRGLGLAPDLVLDLFDSPESAPEQLARIRDTLDSWLRDRRARGAPVADVLLFYVGHGHTDERGVLSLLVRDSRRNLEAETGLKAPDLARALRLGAPQQRRLIVLDCCFSEAALAGFVGMSGALSQAVAAGAGRAIAEESPGRGTLLFCSSPAGEPSIGAPGAERTLFTGALLDVLREGVPAAGPALSFAELREAAFDRMIAGFGAEAPRPVLHQPDQRQGDLTQLGAFPNRAAGLAEPAPRVVPPPRLPERRPEPPPRPEPPRPEARAAAPPPEPPRDAAPVQPRASRWAWLWRTPKTWRGWAVLVVVGGLLAVAIDNLNTYIAEQEEQAAGFQIMRANTARQAQLDAWVSEGLALEQRQDFVGAQGAYVKAANEGHAVALTRLAAFYETGRPGVPPNWPMAVAMYQQAARQGYAPAQQRLLQRGVGW
jgi:hypothetical protein